MAKSAAKIILSRIIGFLIFLIILIIANSLVLTFNNRVYTNIIGFFNSNLILLLIIFFLGILNEIFWSFYFPFNIIAPVISSILSVHIVTFIYNLWRLSEIYTKINFNIPIRSIYVPVVFIVLIAGYITILARHGKPRREWAEKMKESISDRLERKKERLMRKIDKIDKKMKRKHENVEWKDVGNEFKLVFYNLGRSINSLFRKK